MSEENDHYYEFHATCKEPVLLMTKGTKQDENDSKLIINGPENEMVVSIDLRDGSIEFGDNYEPNAAVETFWKSIALWTPLYDFQQEIKDLEAIIQTQDELIKEYAQQLHAKG